ncbi:MAG: chromosomal replication initiator protein DnaA [Treponema sp.]|jgi:chromosomal replication initiator protein|nr:chromosomal replication initiator protein DnaA [Treponema sp.]
MADLDYEGFWNETLIQLRNDLGEEEFGGWFSDMKYLHTRVDKQDGKTSVVIGVPSAFHRDKVKSRYQNIINSKLTQISNGEITLEYEITGKTEGNGQDLSPPIQGSGEKTSSTVQEPPKPKKKRDKHPQMQDDLTFASYIIGENNNFAANAAIAISKNPGKVYNPLFIYGGVGLGKTHLMQAIGNSVYENSENEVIYITSENFLNEYMERVTRQANGQNTMNLFKNKYRNTDVLLIDDIQILTDKPGVQEELFHTFNALVSAKKQLVFTCDRPPSELKKFSERLLSRFEQGIRVDLQPPRYEVRYAILKSTAENRKADISNEVIDYVSKNISSNIRDLIAALNTLIAYMELMGKPITLEIAQQRLKDTFNASRQANFSMDNIIRVVSDYFSLTPNDLKGRKKTQNIVFARQLAMFIGKEMTDYSTTEIGQDFGGKDHTTVMHSIGKIKGKLLTDPTLNSTIENLKRLIKEFSAKY